MNQDEDSNRSNVLQRAFSLLENPAELTLFVIEDNKIPSAVSAATFCTREGSQFMCLDFLNTVRKQWGELSVLEIIIAAVEEFDLNSIESLSDSVCRLLKDKEERS